MDIRDGMDLFLTQMDANGRSLHTRKQRRRHVLAFAAWLAARSEIEEIDHRDVAEFLASPAARRRPDGKAKKASSMNALRTSLKTLFSYLHQSGLIPQDPSRLVRPAICGLPLPQALSPAEQDRLLATLAQATARDRVLFTLMLRCGLRLGSALALDVEDVDLDLAELRLRSAKGDREERVPVPSAVAKMLTDYLEEREAGPLFQARGGRRLSGRQAQRNFSLLAAEAKLPTTRTHALRHSMATNLLTKTGNLMLVQRALRHRSIGSTVLYLRVDDRQVRAAMEG